MKKKILILSLVVNLIAGAFVLYSFTPKAKNVNDGGGGYVIMRVVDVAGGYATELSVSDGITVLDHQDLTSGFKAEKSRENNQIITKNFFFVNLPLTCSKKIHDIDLEKRDYSSFYFKIMQKIEFFVVFLHTSIT